jgi:hypothetical protein
MSLRSYWIHHTCDAGVICSLDIVADGFRELEGPIQSLSSAVYRLQKAVVNGGRRKTSRGTVVTRVNDIRATRESTPCSIVRKDLATKQR